MQRQFSPFPSDSRRQWRWGCGCSCEWQEVHDQGSWLLYMFLSPSAVYFTLCTGLLGFLPPCPASICGEIVCTTTMKERIWTNYIFALFLSFLRGRNGAQYRWNHHWSMKKYCDFKRDTQSDWLTALIKLSVVHTKARRCVGKFWRQGRTCLRELRFRIFSQNTARIFSEEWSWKWYSL